MTLQEALEIVMGAIDAEALANDPKVREAYQIIDTNAADPNGEIAKTLLLANNRYKEIVRLRKRLDWLQESMRQSVRELELATYPEHNARRIAGTVAVILQNALNRLEYSDR